MQFRKFMKKKKEEPNIYSLTFYDNGDKQISSLPLTSTTDSEYNIPDNTCLVALTLNYNSKIAYNKDIFFFAVKDEVNFLFKGESDHYYLKIPETNTVRLWISGNYKSFETSSKLKEYIKAFIESFKDLEMSNITQKDLKKENTTSEEFEKQLVLSLYRIN